MDAQQAASALFLKREAQNPYLNVVLRTMR